MFSFYKLFQSHLITFPKWQTAQSYLRSQDSDGDENLIEACFTGSKFILQRRAYISYFLLTIYLRVPSLSSMNPHYATLQKCGLRDLLLQPEALKQEGLHIGISELNSSVSNLLLPDLFLCCPDIILMLLRIQPHLLVVLNIHVERETTVLFRSMPIWEYESCFPIWSLGDNMSEAFRN